MNEREHLATLAAMLALNVKDKSPAAHLIARDALAILRIGKQASTQAVRYCNGEGHWEGGRMVWNDADDARWEKRRANMRAKAQEIADRYGATVELGGDPRGYVLRLHLANKASNNLGEGWGVA